MTLHEFMKLRDEAINREEVLLVVKGAEYHTHEDFLENFKKDGSAVGVDDPMKALMLYAGKHWRSIQHYVRTGQEGVEPIEGRVDDLCNYLHLLLGLIEEKKHARDSA